LAYDICPNCFLNRQVTKKISLEEILAGFYYNYEYNNIKDNNYILCVNCFTRFQPKIYYLERNQNNNIPKEINVLSPMNLIKEIDNIFSKKGEISFYNETNEINDNIYLNIIFYFKLFDLPLCVLYVQNNMDKFEKIKDKLKRNLERKKIIKKKHNKDEIFISTFSQKDLNIKINTKLGNNNNNNNNKNDDKKIKVIKEEFNNILEEEKNIWKNIQLKMLEDNNDIIKYEQYTEIEDKNEIINFIKEMKEYNHDSFTYFIIDSETKLNNFLINYEKKKKNNSINLAISEESNGKNENKNKKENKNRLFSPETKSYVNILSDN
jgi:hypothetical protein